MGKRIEVHEEPETEDPYASAAARMERLKRRSSAFIVLKRAGFDPELPDRRDRSDDGLEFLEAEVADAGLTDQYEAAYRNKEWAG